MLELIINMTVNGMFYAGILFIMSAGLQIIFGVLGIINFAHASAYMLGLYFTYALVKSLPSFQPLVWFIPLLAALIVGIIGLFFERILLRLIYNRDHVFQMLFTFGAVLMADDVVRYVWGGYPISIPPIVSKMIEIKGVIFQPLYTLIVIFIAILLAVLLWILFKKTDIGRVVRATSHDEEMTEALGISVSWVRAGTFFFGSAIAGLGGGVMLPITGAWPGVGLEYLILCFVVIAIAGLGSVFGALVSSLLIGMVNSIGIQFFPKFELAIIFLLMAVILSIRPTGLFGTSRN